VIGIKNFRLAHRLQLAPKTLLPFKDEIKMILMMVVGEKVVEETKYASVELLIHASFRTEFKRHPLGFQGLTLHQFRNGFERFVVLV
jgi:hypothetical protein